MEEEKVGDNKEEVVRETASLKTKFRDKIKTHRKEIVTFTVLVLTFLCILVVGYLLLISDQKDSEVNEDSVSQAITPTTIPITKEPLPTPFMDNLEADGDYKPIVFTSTQAHGVSLLPFKITYNSSWDREYENQSPKSELALLKNNHKLTIYQGIFGGSACIFPDSKDEWSNMVMEDDPDRIISEYVEFEKGTEVFRRVEYNHENLDKDKKHFGICIGDVERKIFGSPTYYGSISYTVPLDYDPELMKQMDSFVESLELIDENTQ